MKKILSVLLVALLALPMSAQVIYRSGDKYFADNQQMNKKAFAAYMQENAEANLANQFKSGLTVANAGWGLFGGGLGVETIGFVTMAATGALGAAKDSKGASTDQVAKTVTGAAAAGIAMYITGALASTAGIVCLAVGYSRMHNSADIFCATHNQKPQAYLSVKADQNGLGLALNF